MLPTTGNLDNRLGHVKSNLADIYALLMIKDWRILVLILHRGHSTNISRINIFRHVNDSSHAIWVGTPTEYAAISGQQECIIYGEGHLSNKTLRWIRLGLEDFLQSLSDLIGLLPRIPHIVVTKFWQTLDVSLINDVGAPFSCKSFQLLLDLPQLSGPSRFKTCPGLCIRLNQVFSWASRF